MPPGGELEAEYTAPRRYPLSLAQERLWFLEKLYPGVPVYNIPIALRFKGALDADALHEALDQLAFRHESLRTRFVGTAEGFGQQAVDPAGPMAFSSIDLRENGSAFDKVARAEALRPFDLATEAGVRAVLYRLAEREHVLLMTMHHMVTDGQSINVLLRELGALYASICSGEKPALESVPLQYPDYSTQQRRLAQSEAGNLQLEYWRERLTGAPEILDLPLDRPRPAVQSFRGATHNFVVPADILELLRKSSLLKGTTLFMVLVAAFQVVLSRWSGQRDVLTGVPANGRRTETEGTVGFFVNTLVLRTDLSDDPTFAELVKRVRESLLGAYRYQEIPFEKIVEALSPHRDMSRHPLFQVAINYRPYDFPSSSFGSELLSVKIERLPTDLVKVDLELYIEKCPEGLECRLDFATDLFEEASIRRFAGHFGVLLGAAAKLPSSRISQLPLLTAEERRQILIEWNGTSDGCLDGAAKGLNQAGG